MEILILTNSFDGTADIVSKILTQKEIKFLRWNIDLWNDYEIIFDQNREFTSDNNWFTKSIDNLISFIHIKTNIVYNATLFKYKYSNIVLFILIFLIIYNFIKYIYTKLFV